MKEIHSLEKIAVMLFNLGGPDSLQAVKPFLYNLFSDRDIIKLGPPFLQKPIASLIANIRSKKTMDAYSLIGGKSPILDITFSQAKALEDSLNKEIGLDVQFKVYVGMRYWHPFIHDVIKQIHGEGIKKVIALSLYPQYSIATTGSSLKVIEDSIKQFNLECFYIRSWFDNYLYIDAMVEKIKEGLKSFQAEIDLKTPVLFSAHSLPQRFIDEGDPYLKETKGTIEKILEKIDIEWHLSFQSKSGPVKWLEPSTEEMIYRLSKRGVKNLLIVPISFVSDHIETLYEIDIVYKKMAEELGINLKRTESLNTSPKFIEALKNMVIKAIEGS